MWPISIDTPTLSLYQFMYVWILYCLLCMCMYILFCVCVYGVAQWEEFFQGNSHFFCILLTMRGESQPEIFPDMDRLDNLLIESLEDKMRNCGRKFSFFSKKPKACAEVVNKAEIDNFAWTAIKAKSIACLWFQNILPVGTCQTWFHVKNTAIHFKCERPGFLHEYFAFSTSHSFSLKVKGSQPSHDST